MSVDETFEDLMEKALSCASFHVQCGECHAKTDVYIIPRNLLDRMEAAYKRDCTPTETHKKGDQK